MIGLRTCNLLIDALIPVPRDESRGMAGARVCREIHLAVQRAVRAIVLGVLLLAIAGCGEMYHQPSFRPQEPPRLAPPASAVPVTGAERTYEDVEGRDLMNPIPRDEASSDRGRSLYEVNCAMCHGREGKGDGAVASAYVPQPADLTGSRVQSLTDGDIFLRITNGFSTMPPFRKLLTPDERWHIVNFVRTLGPSQ